MPGKIIGFSSSRLNDDVSHTDALLTPSPPLAPQFVHDSWQPKHEKTECSRAGEQLVVLKRGVERSPRHANNASIAHASTPNRLRPGYPDGEPIVRGGGRRSRDDAGGEDVL